MGESAPVKGVVDGLAVDGRGNGLEWEKLLGSRFCMVGRGYGRFKVPLLVSTPRSHLSIDII
jgi:hypothetical protein